MKHNPMATAHAAGATIGILYVVCRVLVVIMPDAFLAIARSWFHSFEVSQISSASSAFDMGSFVLGLGTSVVTGWAVGYLFAYFYNTFVKK